MTTISTHFRGAARFNVKQPSRSVFEVQVRYAGGWEPLFSFTPADAAAGWREARQLFSTLALRMMHSGKVVKRSRK